MAKAASGDIALEYETFGDPADEAVLLINGLGSQMTRWPEAFCALLVARGLFVIRFDNRRCRPLHLARTGPSTPPSTWPATPRRAGRGRQARRAVVGILHGGMIGQEFAAAYPDRTSPAPRSCPTPASQPAPADSGGDGDAECAAVQSERPQLHRRKRRSAPWPSAARPILAGRRPGRPRPRGGDRAFNPPASPARWPPSAPRATAAPNARPSPRHRGAARRGRPLGAGEGGRDTAANIPGAELRVIEGMGTTCRRRSTRPSSKR